ncbi:type II secretion system F family protein [Nocardia sp. alder85J]|uniref:type II secretion system F family protein n=1 Tax=Nocardia sp. alder85J TaxID=2862949 RepID=UPI001CD2B68E|nr:hypothetical protein [Nocardia sp. alder85J]MCX4093628.1 hypothetical protein [Nocardia sp. alder85J]
MASSARPAGFAGYSSERRVLVEQVGVLPLWAAGPIGSGPKVWAMVLCAAALLAWPGTRSRRRLFRLLGERQLVRKVPYQWLFRIAAGVVLVAAGAGGVGLLMAVCLIGAMAGVRVRRARRVRLHDRECRVLSEGLEAVIGELRVGTHPAAAAATAAAELSGVTGRALTVGAARGRLGGSVADGLISPGTVLADELGRIAMAWRLAEQHGLALVELLSAARSDLSGRMRFREGATAELAGVRATAAVLSALPLLGLALGELMGADPLGVLFGPGVGAVLLPLGTALACAGLWWTDTITDGVSR